MRDSFARATYSSQSTSSSTSPHIKILRPQAAPPKPSRTAPAVAVVPASAASTSLPNKLDKGM
ncbi:MAG: hypothetical protein M3Y77_16750 [Actinomycetota bacterium]|nr:hypothetical protein [Actinomycetota bacterium]